MSTQTQIAPTEGSGEQLRAAGYDVVVAKVPRSRAVKTGDIGWKQAAKRLGGLLGDAEALDHALETASINFGNAGLETGRSAETDVSHHAAGPTNLTNSLSPTNSSVNGTLNGGAGSGSLNAGNSLS